MMNTILRRKHSVVVRISILLVMCIAIFAVPAQNTAAQICEEDCSELVWSLPLPSGDTNLCLNQCNHISDTPLWTTCISNCAGMNSPDPISAISLPSTLPMPSNEATLCLNQCRLIDDMAPWSTCMSNCAGADSPDLTSNVSLPNTAFMPSNDTNVCLNQCNLISDMPLWTTCISSCEGMDSPDPM